MPLTKLGELDRLHDAVQSWIGTRDLIYYGIRGSDASGLAEFSQLSQVISLTDAYTERSDVMSVTAETTAGLRIDLDTEICLPAPSEAAIADALRSALSRPAVIVPYRPTPLISQAVLRAGSRCGYLGMFDRHQAAFEFKPWIDRELSDLGIPTLGWHMITQTDRRLVEDMLDGGPVVVRIPISSGGLGTYRMDAIEDFDAFLSSTGASHVSVSRFRHNATPINVGGVVWKDGVSLHPVSLQLIGIVPLVDRAFGYCGNDFAAVRDLPRVLFDMIEHRSVQIGTWLGKNGYRGAFGIDYLVTDGELLFCEVNPRFQGSSRLSDRISRAVERPGLALEHAAAFIGFPMTRTHQSLFDLAQEIPHLAHAVFHWRGVDTRVDLVAAVEASGRARHLDAIEVICPPNLICARNAVAGRVIFGCPATSTGYNLLAEVRTTIDLISRHLAEPIPSQIDADLTDLNAAVVSHDRRGHARDLVI